MLYKRVILKRFFIYNRTDVMDSTHVTDDGLVRNFLDVFGQTLETEKNSVEEKHNTVKQKVEGETLKQDNYNVK